MAVDKKNQFLWVERYRPLTLKNIILPRSYKMFFSKAIKEKNIPNLLLYSSNPGSGKTTLAKAICLEMDADYLYINSSLENGIDVVRNRIENYACVKSLSGKPKVVILDEFDGATRALQDSLRGFIEKYHNSCRFILTCNYKSKIITPLLSRVQSFDFNFKDEKNVQQMKPMVIKKMAAILKNNNIEYSLDTIVKLVDVYFPDIRSLIQNCQKYSNINGRIDDNIFDYLKIDDSLYDYILEAKFEKARKFIIEKNYNVEELFKDFYDNLLPKIPPQKRPQAILEIAEYEYRNSFVINKEINFSALLIELMRIIRE